MTTALNHSERRRKDTGRFAFSHLLSLVIASAVFILSPNYGLSQLPTDSKPSDDQAIVVVTVTGVGLDAASAEKQAVVSAVEQAVGSYLDHEALVKNEKLIYDKVLSASNGFVKDYQVIEPARKRLSDGLVEIKLTARVQKGLVGAALRGAGVASVAVDGKNLWAEAITRIKGQDDAEALLMDVLSKVSQQILDIQIVDQRPRTIRDSNTGKPKYLWYLDIKPRADWWYAEAVPALKAALDVVALKSREAAIALELGFEISYNGMDLRRDGQIKVYDASSGQWVIRPLVREDEPYDGRIMYRYYGLSHENDEIATSLFHKKLFKGDNIDEASPEHYSPDFILPIREPRFGRQITFIGYHLPKQVFTKIANVFLTPQTRSYWNTQESRKQILQVRLETATKGIVHESKMVMPFILAKGPNCDWDTPLHVGGSYLLFDRREMAHWIRLGFMVELPPDQYKEVTKFTVNWIPGSVADPPAR